MGDKHGKEQGKGQSGKEGRQDEALDPQGEGKEEVKPPPVVVHLEVLEAKGE